MKKILFLLLCTIASYGQVSTGQEQEFDYGIKNNSTQTIVSPNTVVVQGTDGTYGKSSVNVLPLSTATINELKLKSYLSTGLLKNGLIQINADPTKFNVSAGIGIISNFDDPANPTSVIVNFPAFTGVTPAYLLTGNITYVAINSTPAIVMQATPFTPTQRRDLIELGAVIHSNLTTINVVNNISSPSNAGINQLHDLMDFIGALNLEGNKYSANGANLSLNKSAGIIGKRGVNFAIDWKDPHRLAQPAGTALTFRYRTQNGTEGADVTALNPALYDLNNVLTAVPNNKFTIQTVVMFQSGLTRVLYGQNFYDDLASAKAAIFTRNFVIESNAKENGIIRAYIIMRNTTTSLQAIADADIQEAQKFGGVASGGVALTLANIVTALGYTPADDSGVLHKTGNESFTGVKSSINTGATQINGISLTNNGTTGSYSYLSSITSSGRGYAALNTGTADSYYSDVTSTGAGFTSNITPAGSGFAFVGRNDGTNTFTVNKLGDLIGKSYSITGGLASQALLANGTTLSNPISGTGTTGTFPKFTAASTLGNSILSESGANLIVASANAMLRGGTTTDRFTVGNSTSAAYSLYYGATHATTPNLTFITGSSISLFANTLVTGNLEATNNITAPAATTANHVVIKSQLDAVKPYKSYVALLTQTGTNAPTVTVLENTLGGTVVWSRTATGTYLGTLNGVFTIDKTFCTASDVGQNANAFTRCRQTGTTNAFEIITTISGTPNDSLLAKTSIEVRVYL